MFSACAVFEERCNLCKAFDVPEPIVEVDSTKNSKNFDAKKFVNRALANEKIKVYKSAKCAMKHFENIAFKKIKLPSSEEFENSKDAINNLIVTLRAMIDIVREYQFLFE